VNRPTATDWRIAELVVDPERLFVMWAVETHFATRREEFRDHLGPELRIEALVAELKEGGFLNEAEGVLSLTEMGETAVSYIETGPHGRGMPMPDTDADARRTDVILKVLLTLDYLKLCVDHEEASGDGVPLDIVVLPDFVVDVDGAAITELNRPRDGDGLEMVASAQVGSRAGSVLAVLAHLRDLDDEAFQLHYIAKTAPIGKTVLEERLGARLEKAGLQPLRFPLLMPARRPRVAVLGRTQYERVPRQVTRVTGEDLVRADELSRHFYAPVGTLCNARAVYFATDSLVQFRELIELVVIGEPGSSDRSPADRREWKHCGSPPLRHVFIDISALHDDRGQVISGIPDEVWPNLKPVLRKFHEKASDQNSTTARTALTFIVKATTPDDASIGGLGERLMIRPGLDMLLAHCEERLLWYDGERSDALDLKMDTRRSEMREAFVAGLLLYRAVGAAWYAIPRPEKLKYRLRCEQGWTADLIPDPYKEANGREQWPTTEALIFASALAKLWQPRHPERIPDRREFVYQNATEQQRKSWRLIHPGEARGKLADGSPADWCLGVTLLTRDLLHTGQQGTAAKDVIGHIRGVAQAAYLFHPEEWAGNSARVLDIARGETVRAQLALQALRRIALEPVWDEARPAQNGKAYLSDLDGTLLQSSALAETCLRRAFLAMLWEASAASADAARFPLLPGKGTLMEFARDVEEEGIPEVSEFLDRCVTLYHTHIYERARDWAHALKGYPYHTDGDVPKDFKQVLNHPLSYPLLTWVLHKGLQSRRVMHDESPLGVLTAATRRRVFRQMCKTRNGEAWPGVEPADLQDPGQFHRQVASWDARHRRIFESAVGDYWEVHGEPYRQTREALRTLRDVLGVSLYVATEGHHDTQIRKLRAVGLQDFFPEHATMSTGAAATPFEDLSVVQEELERRRGRLEMLKFGRQAVEDSKRRYGQQLGGYAIDSGEAEFEFAPKIMKLLRDVPAPFREEEERTRQEEKYLTVLEEQWCAFGDKTLGNIYRLVIASVMADPKRPLLALISLRHLELSLATEPAAVHPMRFAMVGDRETKDILPVLQEGSSGEDKAATVRLLTRDHMDEDVYWDGGKPRAHYVAWSPTQTVFLLADERNWCPPIDRTSVPAAIPGRIAEPDGTIKDDYFEAMFWSESMAWRGERGSSAFSLISQLVIRGTVRDEGIDILRLAHNLSERLSAAKKKGDAARCLFILSVFERLVSTLPKGDGGTVTEVSVVVRDAIWDAFQAGFANRSLDLAALDLLSVLSERCEPPEGFGEPLSRDLDPQVAERYQRLARRWSRG